jgi:hypothetical protein
MLDWTGARVMKLFLLVEALEFQRFNSFDGEDPNKGVNPDEAVSYGTSVGCGTTYSWSPKRISLDRKALEWLDGNQNAEKEDCERKAEGGGSCMQPHIHFCLSDIWWSPWRCSRWRKVRTNLTMFFNFFFFLILHRQNKLSEPSPLISIIR